MFFFVFFLSVERIGGVMAFALNDIKNNDIVLLDYWNVDPYSSDNEGMVYLDENNSATGNPILIIGTAFGGERMTIFELDCNLVNGTLLIYILKKEPIISPIIAKYQ